MRRRLRPILVAAVALVAVPTLATGATAFAIAHAPNAAEPVRVAPPPAELAAYHAREVEVRVGPPAARLSAWVLEPRDAQPVQGTVVVLHGVRLEKSTMLPVATALADVGFRSVLVDLRGHGGSTGEYLTYGIVESHDISELLDTLERDGTKLGPVGVHGFSYGAATALQLAANDRRVRAVVAVASFASLRSVVRDYVHWQAPALLPFVSDRWLDAAIDLGGRVASFDPDAASPARAVSHASADVLLIHGEGDPQVPPSHALAIERASSGHARLMLLPGETHASILADRRGAVRRASTWWFEVHLAGRETAENPTNRHAPVAPLARRQSPTKR